jgi:glucans biosynthesis protein
MTVSRRDVVTGLLSGGALALEAGGATAAGAGRGIRLGPARPFSDQGLDDQARALAGRPFRARPAAWEGGLAALDFDALGAIRFRPEAALWRGDARIGAVEFFHPGKYARAPVAIHEVDAGVAREVLYARSLFDIPPGNPARRLPADLGFAGFRVMNPAAPGDWIAYQGASYFRAADPFNQYGLSARGLAIDTAVAEPEEFPAFTAFWLERAPEGLVVHALLEGPSVAGAYRIEHRRGPAGLVQTLKARLYFRRAVQRLGLAPLTSMFWYGPADHARASDWRPQVHDSDGLSMWTGVGERIWRPLGNPPRVVTNALRDAGPKGFGLMQRDRAFADYQDDGAFYNRRPSAWVEPLDGGDPAVWGLGSAQLVEIPTDDETDDNIVAFWTPQRPVEAGDSLAYAYRLHWTAEEPIPLGVAQVVATRVGRAGRPGQPPTPGARK